MSLPARAIAPLEPIDFIDHPSGHLALSARNRRFALDGTNGFIAYREQGRHFITFGGVHAEESTRGALLDEFLAFAAKNKRRVIAVQIRREQVGLHRSRGFLVNRFGSSFSLPLAGFSLAGTARMKLRNKIKRARAAGLQVLEVGRELPRDGAIFDEIARVSDAWLGAKHKPELDFMIGEIGRPEDRERRVFVARHGAETIGFITYVPSPGARPGWLHDLTRRRPDAPAGTMELINSVAIERFVGERAAWLHFGFTPFIVEGEAETGENRWIARVIQWLGRYGAAVYPARNQVEYKLKWRPDVVEAEYLGFAPFSLRGVYDLLRVTRSI